MKPTVFILCCNSEKNIFNCFKEIKKNFNKCKKIYFVDNASTDNTVDLIKKYKKDFHINNLSIIRNKKAKCKILSSINKQKNIFAKYL